MRYLNLIFFYIIIIFEFIFSNIKKFLNNKNLKDISYVYTFAYLAAPIGYAIRILLSEKLTLEQFGLMYAIIGFYMFISIFISLGLPFSFNYYGVKYFNEKKYSEFKSLFVFTLSIQSALLLLCGIIIYFLSEFLVNNYFKVEYSGMIIISFMIYFAFLNLLKTIIFSYIAVKNFFIANIITFSQLCLIVIGIIIFPFDTNFNSLIGLVWGIPCLTIFTLFTSLFVIKYNYMFKEKLKFSKSLINDNFKYGIQILIGSSGLYIITRIDVLFVTYFFSVSDVGIYEVALSISMILSTLFNPINRFLFPYTSEKKFEDSIKSLQELCFKIYHYFLYLSLPFVGLFVIYSKEIVLLLFSENFSNSITLLPILSIAVLFFIFQQLNFSILAGLNELKIRNKILLIGATLNIILNLVLIKFIGLAGISWGSLFSFSFIFFYSYYELIKRKVLVFFNITKLVLNIIGVSVFLILVYYLKYWIEFPFRFGLLIEIGLVLSIGGIVYLVFGLIMFRKELMELIQKYD